MTELRFMERLRNEVFAETFSVEKAERLSVEIHKAEAGGYTVSKMEESLWSAMTVKVFNARKEYPWK